MRFWRFPAMGHEQKSAKTFDSYLICKSLLTLSRMGPLSPERKRQQYGQSNSLKSVLWDSVESLVKAGRERIASFLCSQWKLHARARGRPRAKLQSWLVLFRGEGEYFWYLLFLKDVKWIWTSRYILGPPRNANMLISPFVVWWSLLYGVFSGIFSFPWQYNVYLQLWQG